MEVRKDFGTRMTALAEGVPRNVVATLLKRLMPPEPVKVRRPEGGWKLDAAPAARLGGEYVDPFAPKVARKLRKPRRGAIVHCEYLVVNPYGDLNHRRGTWTYAMVHSVLKAYEDNDEGTTTAADAHAYLAEHFPKYADRKIDWNWLAKDVGYIELK